MYSLEFLFAKMSKIQFSSDFDVHLSSQHFMHQLTDKVTRASLHGMCDEGHLALFVCFFFFFGFLSIYLWLCHHISMRPFIFGNPIYMKANLVGFC